MFIEKIYIYRLAVGILRGRGGISLSGNEDRLEILVIFYKLFQLNQTRRIRNGSFILAIFGECTPGNYCNDYSLVSIYSKLYDHNTKNKAII